MPPKQKSSKKSLETIGECFACSAPSKRKCTICEKPVCETCKPKTRCAHLPVTKREKWCLGLFTFEGPPFSYGITAENLLEFKEAGNMGLTEEKLAEAMKTLSVSHASRLSGDAISRTLKGSDPKTEALLFSFLQEKERKSLPPSKAAFEVSSKDVELITSPFKSLMVNALFCDLSGSYFYVKLVIKPSLIEAAGMGVFAIEKIPRGSYGYYKGVLKSEETYNPHYSWTIRKWDPVSGDELEGGEDMYYMDASDLRHSNWTRYVNCPSHGVKCNMFMEQSFSQVKYVAKEDILPGDELYIDYGRGYRVDNIGMQTKNYLTKPWCTASYRGGHLAVRLPTRHLPQRAGFDEDVSLPSMNLFECKKAKCSASQSDPQFFCDACERLYFLKEVSLFCVECSKMFCQDCQDQSCHDPLSSEED